jgi:prepilin-type N-terminal cleavage/methylation domain-containing protein
MTRVRASDGFTLVELLVTIALMLLVFGAILVVFETFQRDARYGQLRNETQDNARNALDRLSRELRNVAAPSTKAAGAVEAASANSLIFQTIDPSKASGASVLRVRYCLDDSKPENEVLWRQVKAEPLGTPNVTTLNGQSCPGSGYWEAKSRLATHVVNRIGGQARAAFAFTPASWTSATQIVAVEPTLYLDPKPDTRPGETQLTTSISLRNENRPPTASFSAPQLGASRIVALNASESTDPDGLALTYAWWDNGTRLESTSQQVETKELALNSSHTFKLEVTDPGGLSSTAERTVVIK